jgi:adenylosuccinate lyase
MSSSYETPLVSRYASPEMAELFSPHHRTLVWRRLWIALAEAEQELGVAISDDQIAEMKANANRVDWDAITRFESECRHDVMAHILAFGEICPKARPIIHLGATSATITDNGDLLQMREALGLIREKLQGVIKHLANLANRWKDLACVGFTHLQPAQPTTVGKRFCLWIQDFVMDLHDLDHRLETMQFLGLNGATGTQASFAQLIGDRVPELERAFARRAGFSRIFPIAGQTYPRKQDVQLLEVLAGIATSAHKFATDLRLLAHMGEVSEPFGERQVGSSAMPHKRNPILSERICSLSRYLIQLVGNTSYTAALQWLERSLDDSANRRLTIPEAFLCADAVLELILSLDPVVHPETIAANLEGELPNLSAEAELIAGVQAGGDRQVLHEELRNEKRPSLRPADTGRAAIQVSKFLAEI